MDTDDFDDDEEEEEEEEEDMVREVGGVVRSGGQGAEELVGEEVGGPDPKKEQEAGTVSPLSPSHSAGMVEGEGAGPGS